MTLQKASVHQYVLYCVIIFYDKSVEGEKLIKEEYLFTQVPWLGAYRVGMHTCISLTLESECLTLQNVFWLF